MVYADPVNLTNVIGLVEYSNSVTDNWFGVMIPITLLIIVFIHLKLKDHYTADCLMAAGFISTIVAIFLRLASVITTFHLFFFIMITVLAAMWGFFTGKNAS